MRRFRLLVAAAAAVFASACGGGDGEDASSDEVNRPTTTAEPSAETMTTQGPRQPEQLPPGATPGLDDYAGDGELDPTCGTRDFGAGLVLRVPCEASTPSEPPDGVTLVEGSLFGFNASVDISLDGISGSLLLARDEAGTRVAIFTNNSDALFDSGSDQIKEPETLDGTIRVINEHFPDSRIQVRGHTDSVGSASSNQTLSERRAANVLTYLRDHGIRAAEQTSVGLGSTQPFAVETNDEGRAFNRRVEIVLRVPE